MKPFKSVLSAIACAALGACAVTPGQVSEQADIKTAHIDNAQSASKSQKAQEPPLLRIKGNFLGSAAQPLTDSFSLPARLRDVTLGYGAAQGSLATVAANLRADLGLSVRINSDVTATAGRTANASTTPSASVAPNTRGVPAPSASAGTAVSAMSAASSDATGAGTGPLLPLSFKGDLADYLNQIASTLGIQWEYTNGGIHFYRLVTRVFSVMVSPGSIAYKDEMNGGGSGSTGSNSTGSTSQNSGTFGSSSSTQINASYDPWATVVDGLKTLVTAGGKYAVNQSSGTVIVTDTKESVDRIGKWLDHENASLKTQIAVDIREITVQINDATQVGVDLSLVYQKFNDVTGAQDWVFKFNGPTSLTDSTAGSVGYNIARPDSRLAGTSLAAKALNSFGRVVADTTNTILTTNRVPGRQQSLTDQAYLASTTPASGSSTTSGTGVPGLTPGVVTYGSNLTVVPTIGENNTVLLQLFDIQSDLLAINSVSTGSGATLQLINTPTLQRRKFAQNFVVGQGETLIIVGSASEGWNSGTNYGIAGASNTGKKTKSMQVLMVTPRILQGT